MNKLFSIFWEKLKKYKVGLKIVGLFAALAVITYLANTGYIYYRRHSGPLTIGFVTDIHSGKTKTKEKGSTSGVIFPWNFEKNLKSALNDMRYDHYIIALGDNVDQRKNCQKYAGDLKRITRGYNVLWVKGNHDVDACFPYLSSKRYFYLDDRDWRIMIIDNSHWYPKDQRSHVKDKIGVIDQEQLDWIKNALNTDKKVLIAMHIPIFDDNGQGKEFTIRPDYVEFKKMLEERRNVKYVLAGHYHNDNWQHEENGITYYILPSIELQGGEGYHMVLKLE